MRKFISENEKTIKRTIIVFSTIVALSIFGVVIVKQVNLKQNCTGYLKRAADANTVEVANKELSKSIKYLEENNLTTGYTSILYQTPDEDVEFWYNNLKASQKELSKVNSNTSTLEKTNILMKLRETLIDNGSKGDYLTVPDGLSRYPHNGLYCVLLILASLIVCGLIFIIIIELSK